MEESASAARRVALNTLNPFAAQVLTKLLLSGYAIVQYRLVDPVLLGDYFLAGLVLLYASTISEWGLGTLLTRDVARDRTQVGRLFAQTLLLRVLISLSLFLPVIVFLLLETTLFKFSAGGAWSLLILTLSLLPGAFSGTVSSVLYAYERMTLPAVIGIGTSALNVAFGLIALLMGWGVIGLSLAALLSTTATALFFWRILKRELPEVSSNILPASLRIDRRLASDLLRSGWPLLLNGLLVGLFFRVDQFILQPVLGGKSVAQYQAPYSYLNFVLLITPAVTLALFPRMSRHAKDDMPRLAREYNFALKLLVSLSGLIVALTVWFAPLLVTIVTGGKEGYLPDSSVALQILILFLPFSFINGVTQYVLIALNKQSLITRAFAATLVFNVAANLVLVPLLGISGAAIVTVLSELVLLVPFLLWIRRELAQAGGGPTFALVSRPLVAAAVTSALMYLAWSVFAAWNRDLGGLVFYVAIGVLLAGVYTGVLFALRPFTSEETRMLKRAVRRST